ncbi:glycosyltransferase family 4 protein [Chloroflexales bacterium ZM16-3]|nr:glycosyltransferase family 4 protein [Chloroflexales bacterium ZM16-3]
MLDLAPGLSSHMRGTLQGAIQVRHALSSEDYDVAFFNTQVPAALADSRLWQRPFVIATDITPIQYDVMASKYGHVPDQIGPVANYKHRVNVAALRGAARVLPWSKWARDSLVSDYGVAADRVDIVPPGVDLGLWRAVRRRPEGPLRILFVGGDFERKGGATLLAAFRSLPSGMAELHLVTRATISSEEGVYLYNAMRPNSPELIALYHASHVFVLPTDAEAFGIAAIEASAAGLALITTAVGGLRDVVSDGRTGFFIPPRDPETLGERLRTLAGNPSLREMMGRAARARAEQLFSAQRNAARVIAHLRDVARI